ncbi:MAG: phosphatidylinositol-specific phospholipase C domain-containing protein [Clostridia bacterium]|nr:phosphatidylinositol-specific phospholipase C domain-containing protein [Clostridia bacterium]
MSKSLLKESAGKRILRSLLLLILLAVILLAGFLWLAPVFETQRTGTNAHADVSRSWMSMIPDERPINEITVPGTHDSASRFAMLSYFTKCQASSVRTQLEDGFRFLDIRLGNEDDGRISLWHGFCRCRKGFFPWEQTVYLEDVLGDCYSFLENNPSEAVIFCVKHEHGDDLVRMQKVLHEQIGQRPEMWYLSDSIPTMGECRGKLVLVRRYDDILGLGKEAGLDIAWSDQAGGRAEMLDAAVETKNGFILVIQDRYKYGAEEKWSAFTKGLEKTAGTDNDTVLSIHYLSTNGTEAFGHPYAHAKILNDRILSLDNSKFELRWIVLDFSDSELAYTIYSSNFGK